MSTIKSSTTSTTAYQVVADTTGTLVFQTGATPTTAMTLGSDQSVTFAGAQTYTGGATFNSSISVQGITVGRGAGAVSTNTALGASALAANTSGAYSVAVGYNAGLANQTGVELTLVGFEAGKATTGSGGLTAVGVQSGLKNTTGIQNTFIGGYAGKENTTGSYSVALGYLALQSNTTASNNTAVGYQAGYSNTTGTAQVFVGRQAGYGNTGSYNTAVGELALYTSGSSINNVAVGQGAMYLNTSGNANTALGMNALLNNTTASNNTAVGYQAGYSNTTGERNVSLGYQAGYAATTNGYSTFLGTYSGLGTTGQRNTFIGEGSGYLVTSGAQNTILGRYNGNQGGLDIRTASNYVVLSDGDGNPRGIFDGSGNLLLAKTSFSGVSGTGTIVGTDGRINVVNAATTNAFSTYELYSTGVSAYRFYVGSAGTVFATNTAITGISDARLKENIRDLDDGLDVVMALKPRKFDWKEGKGAGTKNARGFIAQEFEQVLPDMIEEWKDPAPEGEEPYKAVNANLIPTLVKAIQELKMEFDAYKAAHP